MTQPTRSAMVLAILLISFICAAHAAEPAPVTAFVDVNVVPMDRERVLRGQTVLVVGDRIEAVGPVASVAVPADARRIEGGGTAWLLPGLVDMHTHLMSAEDAALYLAAGVTTVLQMGGEGRVDPVPVLRALLRDAQSPQLFFALMVDGATPQSGGWPVTSVEQARFAAQVAKDRSYDFIKVYNGVTSGQFDALVDEGRKLGLPVIGHGARDVGLPAALFRGQVMVAHLEEFLYTTLRGKPDDARIGEIAADVRRSGAYVTPNLSFIEAIIRQWGDPEERARMFAHPLVPYLSPYTRWMWASPRRNYAAQTGGRAGWNAQFAFLQRLTLEMHRQGVPLLAGTDTPILPGLLPGIGLVEELRTLTEAGLTPWEALATATRNPGEFFARYVPQAQPLGRIEPGLRADLLLLGADPTRGVDALRTPLGVMKAGRWRSAEELRAGLEANRKAMDPVLRDAYGEGSRR